MDDLKKHSDEMTRRTDTRINGMGKVSKVTGWVFVVIGGILTMSVIGSLLGIPLFLIGCCLILWEKSMKRVSIDMAQVQKVIISEYADKYCTSENEKRSFRSGGD